MLVQIVDKPIGTTIVCGQKFPQLFTIERHDPKARVATAVCAITGTVEKHILSGVKWGTLA